MSELPSRAAVEPTPPPVETDANGSKILHAAAKRYESLSGLLAKGPPALADADYVHDLRVASRRLGEVARLLKPFMDKPATKAVDASLKSLRRAMGELRDSDVTCEHLVKWRMPAPLKIIARHIADNLEAGRAALVENASAQITSASLGGTMVVLARILETCAMPAAAIETERRLAAGLSSQIKKRTKKLRRSFGDAAQKQTPASLHAARIAAKKLRYLLELAGDADARPDANQKSRFLKKIQQLLGDHHDTHVIALQLKAHLQGPELTANTNILPAWHKWQKEMNKLQAERAGAFFTKTYAWLNT